MKEKDLTEAVNTNAKLSEAEVTSVTELPFELVQKHYRKTTKLLANSRETASLDYRNRWFDYEFEEPVFLTEILVEVDNAASYQDFEFRWTTVDGESRKTELARYDETSYRCTINQLVVSIEFRPPSATFRKRRIDRVRLFGFQKDELEHFVGEVANLEALRDRIIRECNTALDNARQANENIANLSEQRNTLSAEIQSRQSTADKIQDDISGLEETLDSVTQELKGHRETTSQLQKRQSDIEAKIEERTAERSTLAAEIESQKATLRELQSDINMFPTEIREFTRQAGQNIRFYWMLSAVPILILISMTLALLFNAAGLATRMVNPDEVWAVIVTRTPYVALASAIIVASYKFARILISEMMRINQQKLNLSKVSIIATDVSHASEHGLDELSDEKVYELRTDLKMDMLRDHLKEYLSESFVEDRQKRAEHIFAELMRRKARNKETPTASTVTPEGEDVSERIEAESA